MKTIISNEETFWKTTMVFNLYGITMNQICDKRENFAFQALHTAHNFFNESKFYTNTNLELAYFIKIENKNSGK